MDTCEENGKAIKRKFCEAWLTDERSKHWIRRVPNNESLFYCTICNTHFSCSTRISRHMYCAGHKNILNASSLPNTDNTDSNTENNKRYRKFRPQWLEMEVFKSWLEEIPNNETHCYCSICKITILSHSTVLYKHAESSSHKQKCENRDLTNQLNSCDTQFDESLLTFDDQKKAAEIRYAALISEKNIPYQTANEILSFFQNIGNNYNILKSMTLSPVKCTSIISNVLCPVETERIVHDIQNTKFSIFIDETSDSTNNKWMTFLVRYIDRKTLNVKTQLLKLIQLDATNCSADKLFNAFESAMYKFQIPFSNILALSCDNASVMTGKHKSFKQKLEQKCKHLITISCPCHSAALVVHAACAKLPDMCEEFVKKLANYINSSPRRAAIFNDLQECFQYTNYKVVRLCDTRWLSRYSCIERILKLWVTIKHFLLEISTDEKSETAQYLLNLLNRVDTKAYLLFLKYVLNFVNSFNAFFQATETKIHLLQPESFKLLIKISGHFLKPELLSTSILNVSFQEETNHKSLHDISLGYECEQYISKLQDHENDIKLIRQNCLQFYITAAEEIKKRLPVNDTFLSKLQVLSSMAIFDENRNKSLNNILFIANRLHGFDEDGLKTEWHALYSDFTNDEKNSFRNITSFDEIWKKILTCKTSHSYPNLQLLINSIRSLPNSNADPERIFSLITDLKSKKRNKLSATCINAACVFKSALKARGETALTMKITEQHLTKMTTDMLYLRANKNNKSRFTLHAADTYYDSDIPSSSVDTR